MQIFSWINRGCDHLAAPFSGLTPLWGLVLISFISAMVLLLLFKALSNQEKIKRHKDKIVGHFLEIALYRDQFWRTMRCQTSILKHNLLYLRYFLFPLLVMMPPVIIVCMQLDFRLGSQPLQKDHPFILQVALDETQVTAIETTLNEIRITTTDNIALETDALRSTSEASVFWRAHILDQEGEHTITIKPGPNHKEIRKTIVTDNISGRFSPDKRKMKTIEDGLFSGEEAISNDSPVRLVRVNYPPATYPLLAWQFSPIVFYFILTLLFGFLVKPFIKVNI